MAPYVTFLYRMPTSSSHLCQCLQVFVILQWVFFLGLGESLKPWT